MSLAMSYLKWSALIVIPVGTAMLVSVANGKGKRLTKKSDADVPKAFVDLAPVAEGAVTVGWYFYAGRWIRLDEFVADAKVSVAEMPAWAPAAATAGVTDEVTYQGRFRWNVMSNMATGANAIGIETTYATGVATKTIGYAAAAELTEEARAIAQKNAADKAAKWIDTAVGNEAAS